MDTKKIQELLEQLDWIEEFIVLDYDADVLLEIMCQDELSVKHQFSNRRGASMDTRVEIIRRCSGRICLIGEILDDYHADSESMLAFDGDSIVSIRKSIMTVKQRVINDMNKLVYKEDK